MEHERFQVGYLNGEARYYRSLYEALIIATELMKNSHVIGLAVIDHQARPGSTQVWAVNAGRLVSISMKEE